MPVGFAPGHVVRVLRTVKSAQMLSFRRKNPEATRAAHIDIAAPIHLDAVNGILTGSGCQVGEEFSLAECRIRVHRVTVHHFLVVIPIADIHESFIRGKSQAVRPGELRGQELQLTVFDRISP
jgi:hypothetical protein